MPSSTSSSDAARPLARLWLRVFGGCFALVVGLLAITFATPAPYGDLTRIGALSDSEFGWRGTQPAIAEQDLVSASLSEADVLVVGDSFSIAPGTPVPAGSLVWQTRLVQAGYRVASLHWSKAHPLCPDFADWLRQQGFRGKWVLLESVERQLQGHLQSQAECLHIRRADGSAYQAPAPAQQAPAFALNTRERLLTGASTRWNTWRAVRSTEPSLFQDPSASESTRLHPLPQGCQYFSHRRCDKALFLAEDELRPRFLSQWQALLQDPLPQGTWRSAWLIIPNKTTFYLDPEPMRQPSRALADRGLGPDLMAALDQQRNSLRDLYYPNDTHLSPAGALKLGDAVLAWLRAQP